VVPEPIRLDHQPKLGPEEVDLEAVHPPASPRLG
jgi:hypothetical protein